MRLIDADALKQEIREAIKHLRNYQGVAICLRALNDAPTVEAEPVRHCGAKMDRGLKEYQEWREEQDENLKDAARLTAEAAKQLSDAIIRAENTPCIQFNGKALTIAEAIKTLRNGNGGTVMLWRKCSEAQPKTPRNALVLIDGRFALAYWNGYEWQPEDYRIGIHTEYWQNLPPLPAEMMRNGE